MATSTVHFVFSCDKCGNHSEELKDESYLRLKPNQIWICQVCKEKAESEITGEKEFAGGYIIIKSDF